jgi:hypothetical protein
MFQIFKMITTETGYENHTAKLLFAVAKCHLSGIVNIL